MNPLSHYFTVIETDKSKQPKPRYMDVTGTGPHGNKTYKEPIGPYLSISGPGVSYRSLWVSASDEVMEFIANSMLGIDRDSISFELIRPNGSTDYVLYAKYNLILGSRIIGGVSAESIPTS